MYSKKEGSPIDILKKRGLHAVIKGVEAAAKCEFKRKDISGFFAYLFCFLCLFVLGFGSQSVDVLLQAVDRPVSHLVVQLVSQVVTDVHV